MAADSIPKKGKTNVAHIGWERFDSLKQDAIDLSSIARQQITGSQFLKFIIDEYQGVAKTGFMQKLRKENESQEDK
ncbi:hypothetical protein [Pseudomonas chlororaphis]|uniref:hypothetical protein n=1 Tax=Pseudomonas chlororaphis TaxID=587753 RepID=UPI002D764C5B|nr:hypothetical protein [Pseudomonas chlororaphis]